MALNLQETLEQLDAEYPHAMEALRAAAYDRQFAPYGLRNQKLNALLRFIDEMAGDTSVPRFGLNDATIFTAALKGETIEIVSDEITELNDENNVVATFNSGNGPLNRLKLVKEPKCYVVQFTMDQVDEASRQLGRWASAPGETFSWYDAAVMSKEIRKIAPANSQKP